MNVALHVHCINCDHGHESMPVITNLFHEQATSIIALRVARSRCRVCRLLIENDKIRNIAQSVCTDILQKVNMYVRQIS